MPADVKAKWDEIICGGYAAEADVKATIGRVFKENGYTLDPHTAVAVKVYEDYAAANNDDHQVVVVSTASPFKLGSVGSYHRRSCAGGFRKPSAE